jgi:hypothetical protein
MKKKFIKTLVVLCSAVMLMITFAGCSTTGASSMDTSVKGVEKRPTIQQVLAAIEVQNTFNKHAFYHQSVS